MRKQPGKSKKYTQSGLAYLWVLYSSSLPLGFLLCSFPSGNKHSKYPAGKENCIVPKNPGQIVYFVHRYISTYSGQMQNWTVFHTVWQVPRAIFFHQHKTSIPLTQLCAQVQITGQKVQMPMPNLDRSLLISSTHN